MSLQGLPAGLECITMPKDFNTMEDSNPSSNPSIHDVSNPARRLWVRGAGGGALLSALAGWGGSAGLGPLLAATGLAGGVAALTGCATGQALDAGPERGGRQPVGLGFKGIAPSTADALQVPEGYIATVIAAWGEPIGVPGQQPPFRFDASNPADEQAVQMGMHHDGLHFYPLHDDGTPAAMPTPPTPGHKGPPLQSAAHGAATAGNRRGLLAMNHEYTDEGLLHPDGLGAGSAEKVRKSQNAHGLSVIEVALRDGQWQMVRPSRYARRVTMSTPFAVGGPAAGHPMMRTAADPTGRRVLGTMNNCASGQTPWGTYLSGEENWAGYFRGPTQPNEHERRWGIRANGGWNKWSDHDERFNAALHPNEPNRFGWIVELDPMDPTSTPVKRTALGRAAHEGAWVATTREGRAVVYSGEDARFEYIYKFVSRDRIKPAGHGLTAAQANRDLLDHGTLYVARFEADGTGRWLPLVHGQGPLTAANGFADQGDVVIKARQASDLLGATKMDRPEWLAIDERSRWVYCTLTNNTARGTAGQPGVDAANPRARNEMGQIIRWQERGDLDGETFIWNHLMLAGIAQSSDPNARGNIRGDAFACPDGIAFDPRGVLWIQTDVGPANLKKGVHQPLGNNQMLACDVATGEVRRFLVGPVNCEVTGVTWTPDGRTMFLNIQHPGEGAGERLSPQNPRQNSNWPDFRPDGRPRSATVVVRRRDGGVIGA
jgi:secreted PhoX family phosphatase